MYEKLELFRTASAMAQYAGRRQAIVARNIANADTPEFQARGLPSFQDIYRPGAGTSLKATRPGHLGQGDASLAQSRPTATGEPSPNGNTVSLEEELLQSVAIGREHSRALSIYRHAMTVLRTSLGRG